MKIKDCMRTDMATVSIDATFQEVKEKMLEEGTSVVVVKSGEEIVGIVTETDIFAYAASGRDLSSLKVEKRMTVCDSRGFNPCIQVSENSPIEDAIKIMAVSGVHHLLVWGKSGKICGVISSEDVLKIVD